MLARRVMATVVALAALTAPPLAPAQGSAAMRRIAFLIGDDTCSANIGHQALREGLLALGYRAGENLEIDCLTAEGRYERLDELAQRLVQRRPAVIVAAAAPASLAAQRATSVIPVVAVYTADPVALGLVASLGRPQGNVTGISALAMDHAPKSLQLLKELVPGASRVGVLGHAGNATYAIYQGELQSAARTLGLTADFAAVRTTDEIDAALAGLQQRGAHALLVMHQPFTFVHRTQIVETVARLRLPAMYGSAEAVEAGGLVSYAANVPDTFRRAARLVDRLLKGARPADLPVEQPTTLELALNVGTARALGLAIPPALRVRADKVID